MKKRIPQVDYRKFRLHKLGDPEFSHLKLLLGWVVYFILFFLTEQLIPAEKCHPVHCAMDDWIPFCEFFVVPYVLWYGYIVLTLLHMLLYNIELFRRLSKYIIITQMTAIVIYIFLPSRQDLRPLDFPRENACTQLISLLYAVDTNTGVCPSMHVAISIALASAWIKENGTGTAWRVCLVAFAVLVCLSTVFIKQHSVLDALAALPICLFAEWFCYHRKAKTA